MFEEMDLENCYFVPFSTMDKVIELLQSPSIMPNRLCKRSLLRMQTLRSNDNYEIDRSKWRNRFQIAIVRAIYSHDWNKLLYLLKKVPVWHHSHKRPDELPLYIRALTILLMYHPSAKAQSLLLEYMHMVLACRSDQDKKALLKLILSLPEKILGRHSKHLTLI